MSVLRFAVGSFGACFLCLGVIAAIGPGFPIADSAPKSAFQLYLQVLLNLIYGAALVSAAVVPDRPASAISPLVLLLVLTPLALFGASWISTPITVSVAFLPLFALLSGAGISVLFRRRAA